MKKKTRYTVSKVCITSFASLFGLSLLLSSIANNNVNAINTFFGTSSYKKVDTGSTGESTEYYESKYNNINSLITDTDNLIAEIEEEGAVLLKNNGALPLASNAKVTTYGIGSVRSTTSSTGSISSSSATGREVSLKQGLEAAGLSVNPTVWNWYNDNQASYSVKRNGMMAAGPLIETVNEVPWTTINGATSSSVSGYGDAAIMNIVRVSGEGNKDVNRSGCTDTPNGDALTLSNEEIGVLQGLKSLKDAGTISKIIVIINCTANPDMGFLADDLYGIDAALSVGSVGTTGWNGVARLITGAVNPSGKLSDTMWYANKENPTLTNQAGYAFDNPSNLELHTGTAGAGTYENYYVVYQEGVYLGYKYSETRYSDYVTGRTGVGDFDYSKTIAYPFGYGLSYTDFSYTDYKVSKSGDDYKVSVTVKNTGTVAGKDAVEVYVQKPYDTYASENGIGIPAVSLVGYEKTSTLAAGASEVVTVTVPAKEFASYDSNNAKTYVLTSGDYYLTIGNGAHDAVNNILTAQGYTSGSKLVGTGNADLAKVALSQKNVDKTTYSTAVTGEKITNLFDDSDLNKYSETKSTGVTYINRSNWEDTVVLDPLDSNTSYTKTTMTQNMLNDFRSGWDGSMLKEDDVAYPTYGQSAGLNLIDMRVDSDGNEIPYDSEIWDTFMDQLTWDDTVSLLSEGMRMTAGLESIGKPATLDHNGPLGVTQNYASGVNGLAYKNGVDSSEKSSTFPCMFIFAGSFNKDLETRVGENYGENCLWAGYSGLYGPGMNIHRSQYSCRNAEYYSEDGFLSGVTAAHQIKAIQSKGVYVYIKHFALNDQETHRYGLSTWLNEQSFREIYLKPFEISIQEGGAHAMMSSYNRVGTKVAAVSSNLVTDWLRGEQGFDGFVVTDMYQTSTYYSLTFYMGMVQMPAAVLSGNDLVDGSITSVGQFDAYKTGYGELANAMRTSCKRILYTCVHSSAMNGWSSTTKLVKVQTSWQIGLLASEITLGILAAASLGFFGYCFYDKNLKKKKED